LPDQRGEKGGGFVKKTETTLLAALRNRIKEKTGLFRRGPGLPCLPPPVTEAAKGVNWEEEVKPPTQEILQSNVYTTPDEICQPNLREN